MRFNQRGTYRGAIKLLVPVLALALVAGACSSNKPGGVEGGGGKTGGAASELTGAGATFPAPLYQRWAEEYQKKANVKINYQAIGSGGGIQQITAKTVDFGASDAPMKDEELAKAAGILHIPMVFGSVVVTYNQPGLTGFKLSPDTLAGIFLGNIKTWNDPKIAADNAGAKLPSKPIRVVHRSEGSGTTNTFTSYLTAVNAEWKTKIGKGKEVKWPAGELGGKGNDGVAATIKQTPGSIGYVELAYAKQSSLPVTSIKNKAGQFIEPTLESTSAAAVGATIPADLRFSIVNAAGEGAYPICSATWLLVYQKQTDKKKGETLVKYLKWTLTEGQSYAKELLYAPLPPALIAKALAKVASITF
ncbi:MAG: phosphate ABC transporter substrate-binding protein PstS [Actinomycetota bacterium]